MEKEHHFNAEIYWTGNIGNGTVNYKSYSRNHIIKAEGRPELLSSSAPTFRGDADRYNPEDLLVASLSSCHMLWYLHLCADAGVNVLEYSDKASGIMIVEKDGSGRFTEVTLHPHVAVANSEMIKKAQELHKEAHEKCFIANSCNFPVHHKPTCVCKDII